MTAIVQFPTATSPSGLRVPSELSDAMGDMPEPDRASHDADVALRQLRHQTKNALQRILCHVANQPGLTDSAAGRALAGDLERRIHLVAMVSDALFGFTKAPDPLEQRLTSLGRSVVELLCDPGQLIDVDVIVQGHCPRSLDEVIVRVAHELVGNAVKHGMHVRLVGRIDIAVRTVGQMTTLTVSDDGWGYSAAAQPGEGLSVAMALAEPFGGTLQMRRDRDRTHVSLTLPHAARRPAMAGHHFA